MCTVQVEIPNEVLYDTHMNQKEALAFARQMVALGYYTRNNVSLGYCAQIAGMSEEGFILFLGKNQISIFRFDDENELLRDIENA